ncbi:DUF6152 family protein [Variovorax sp. PCZ-1]|uniref:DUF6152 family protein n=1 Tax=Variovorax sp. PCZ-1 TaxID=2835533 RepID=UPI001BCEE69D|nr:DUF6152 family protein [Variovorax sp. PCZ-1]MBS7807810.1 hypothetical protein [Variovorax sp. PCZ-1]
MQRRTTLQLIATTALPASLVAHAHHGWSSFDLDRPIYLEGKASKVKWQNAHTELTLELNPGMKLPADLATRSIPAQTAPVDAPALLKKASLPKRTDKAWEIELAPLFRMNAWKVDEIKNGQSLAVLGFTFKDEKGSAILRAEFLWLDGKAYALRSAPA